MPLTLEPGAGQKPAKKPIKSKAENGNGGPGGKHIALYKILILLSFFKKRACRTNINTNRFWAAVGRLWTTKKFSRQIAECVWGAALTALNFLNLTDEELDKPIYRITKQDHVFNLFNEKQNVLTQVHKWKDKFENFQLALGGVLDGERFDYGFKDDFVGQCWTQEYLSEAMWGIYANDPNQRFLRIRSTPRKLLAALADAHPTMPQDTCFLGKVAYQKEKDLKARLAGGGPLSMTTIDIASTLLLKRYAFRHESEVRLLYFGNATDCDEKGLYRYPVDPHAMITQIMADPSRDRSDWPADKAAIKSTTGFTGEIKRSKVYDPPGWELPVYISGG